MRLDGLKRGFAAFNRATSPGGKAAVVIFILIIGGVSIQGISDAFDRYRFDHLSSEEHLRLATDMCRSKFGGSATVCFADDASEASRHLLKSHPPHLNTGTPGNFLILFENERKLTNAPSKESGLKPTNV